MKSSRKFLKAIFTAAALAAFAPSSLFACAACYGKSDSPLAVAMNWGIFTLLGIIVSVLICIAAFFVYIIRKEEAFNNDSTPHNPSDL